MKLLLDENLPKKLKIDLSEHETYTVRDMNWNGIKNGQLMALMLKNGFDVLLTFDRNIEFQQNFNKYPIPVLALIAVDNTYITLREMVPKILKLLNQSLKSGVVEVR